ncbi:hypothetical protein [Mesorhizobium sp. B2-3-5]|uniref:hypothetical protein n=1 Tax=Mesorhizobium sp. B2-3-5 TaxID=2589958 RepID=UPI001127B9A7|nr:hypothetical protein [Mesorhizobium sp. B2-3-5]TPM34786.1 hypothetical protein FJ958_06710 [Mesorhizobium sp. B2-3-5]
MVSADIAVWRACATLSLMRLDSGDGADETAEASRAGGIELMNVLICNSGSLKPVDMTGLARRGCDPVPEMPRNLTTWNIPRKKAGKGNVPRRPAFTRPWVGFRCQNEPI